MPQSPTNASESTPSSKLELHRTQGRAYLQYAEKRAPKKEAQLGEGCSGYATGASFRDFLPVAPSLAWLLQCVEAKESEAVGDSEAV